MHNQKVEWNEKQNDQTGHRIVVGKFGEIIRKKEGEILEERE